MFMKKSLPPVSGLRFLPYLLFVYELRRVRGLRRKALPLLYLGHQREEHVRRDRLPELEGSVPDGLSRCRRPRLRVVRLCKGVLIGDAPSIRNINKAVISHIRENGDVSVA